MPLINRLKQMAVFCQVIDSGSMRSAAEVLGMTPSAISQHINLLEKDLKVSLIYRSTRKISLSEAGELYYHHVKRMLMAAEDADDAIHEVKHSLEGELRISAPVGLACKPLSQALKDLLDNNVGLRLTVLAHDKNIDLVAEHIDIAIRVGEPTESNFIFHSFGNISKSIYASPEYLKKYGNPVTPDDLKKHTWLGIMRNEKFTDICINHFDKKTFEYRPDYRMTFNDLNVLVSHVLEGYGVAMIPDFEVKHLIKSGHLTRVLPNWSSTSHSLYALTIDRKQSYKVKTALKELRKFFSS